MKSIFIIIGQYFRLWFMPQPSHDEMFPEEPAAKAASSAVPAKPKKKSDPFEEFDPAADPGDLQEQDDVPREHLNLNQVDFSENVKPPEGVDNRESRTSFTRNTSE